MRFILVGAAAAFSLAAAAFAQPAAEEPDFSPERFRAHVAFLADDLLEGRDSGSRGYDLAALYVATRFEALGLKPATEGGWYQPVPFLEYKLMAEPPASVTVGGRRFVHGQKAIVHPGPVEGPQSVEAAVVFAGYGLVSPELGIDDYKGLDVRGKVVAVLAGFPKGMPSDVGAHLNSEKNRAAEAKGAIGVIRLRTRADVGRRAWSRLQETADEPSMTWIGRDGEPYLAAPGIRYRATFDTPAAEALFAGARRSFSRVLAQADRTGGSPKGFALRPTVRFEQQSALRRFSSPNVVAVLSGSDPELADEYVLLMAHLDHEGVNPKREGDKIYNGAMDNATGIATMLEVARAMTEGGKRPRRPILFAAVTAEEDGLLGAQYLAKHPLPGVKVVGVVNLDMPVLTYDFRDVIAFGAEHSTMGPAVASAASRMSVALTPDPLPAEGLFTRSDHYRFVQEGVPSVFLMTGFAGEGREKFEHFLATHYHRVSDDMKLPIDWRAGAKFARLNYLIAREIADAPEAPRWYQASFFGDTLAPDRPKAARPKAAAGAR
jgi:hypothetical protein